MKNHTIRKQLLWLSGLLGLSLLGARAATATHDLASDFDLNSNPTVSGWGYNVSVAAGGGLVGPKTDNWNQPDFGPGQPGWQGPTGAAHAGWAKKVDNKSGVHPEYDAPVGTILTHGPTSVAWTVPANDPNHYATISGNVYNIRHFGRSGAWKIYKNDTVLTQGAVDDNSGSSAAPLSFDKGTAGASGLAGIPYVPGDVFRFEALENDFQGVNFTISTTNVGPDPDIASQPKGALVSAGANVTLTAAGLGTAPLSYQWRFNGQDIPGATASTLTLNNVKADQTGSYTVTVANSKGSKTSQPAVVVVDAVGPQTAGVYDLANDFTFLGNPTSRGWTYSDALQTGGAAVGPLTNNWNAATFGPGQPGYLGAKAGSFAGWAKRLNNGTLDTFDAPVGTILTHGPTSVKFTVPAKEANKFATITGNLWSAEKNNRGQGWNIWKNDNVLLAQGVFGGGTSADPKTFESADVAQTLQGIPIKPGDTFRLEILPTSGPGGQLVGPYGDLVGVNFTVTTSNSGPDPAIASNPLGQAAVEGTDVTLNVGAVGTAPFTYQWQLEGNDIPGAASNVLKLANISLTQGGNYTVKVTNSKGSITSIMAKITVTPKPPEARGTRYDLAVDFNLQSNPTPKGWQYSEAFAGGVLSGAPVGPVSQNWNQPDFGPGQPGWLGKVAGVHAGWAKRVKNFPNGAPGDTYDAPVGTVLTHGPTSVLWTAPPEVRPGSVADLSGGLWNIRHLNRPSTWRIYQNDSSILTEGQVADNSGSSAVPLIFVTGSGGAAALKNIPIRPGDSFRFEVGAFGGTSDFVAVQFTITVRQVHDASADFDAAANPSPTGWQYSESVANGGGPVGPFILNWNQPDFGAGQPGWQGGKPGVHAGWAKRIDNGNATPTFDDPIGTMMTHGPTSLLWKAPANDPGGLASLSGGLWNLRHLGRAGTWKIYKNSTALTGGAINDNSGTSSSPLSFARGSAGDVLNDIPYKADDEFRLEILQGDFVGIKFTISTYPSDGSGAPSLAITRSGGSITIRWTGGGTLQSADTLPPTWADVQSASSPYTVSTAGNQKFFRVRK